jgi:hypothetical protein
MVRGAASHKVMRMACEHEALFTPHQTQVAHIAKAQVWRSGGTQDIDWEDHASLCNSNEALTRRETLTCSSALCLHSQGGTNEEKGTAEPLQSAHTRGKMQLGLRLLKFGSVQRTGNAEMAPMAPRHS